MFFSVEQRKCKIQIICSLYGVMFVFHTSTSVARMLVSRVKLTKVFPSVHQVHNNQVTKWGDKMERSFLRAT